MTGRGWDRRRFLGAAGGGALWAALGAPIAAPARPTPWPFDVDGDGAVGAPDRGIIEASLSSTRGTGLTPSRGYDFRADLRALGRVDRTDLALFDRERRRAARALPAAPRPIVVCWHYGWYTDRRRFGEATSVGYLGGPYLSGDAVVEDRFNALKNEFGITAELLSWIDRGPSRENYETGYLSAPSAGSRRFGWLYESTINMGSNGPMDMSPAAPHATRMVRNFRDMALDMLEPGTRRLRSNLLRIDGRPVIYLFASHLFGDAVSNLIHAADALGRARRAFFNVTGVHPWLIGDESPFVEDAELDTGRAFRASFWDAVTRYHHYEAPLVERLGNGAPVRLGGAYLDAIVANERRTFEAFAGVRNRFTDRPLLVIPSSGAGFAKLGLPTLLAGRDDYARFLIAMKELTDSHLASAHAGRLGTAELPAPLVIAGSWNEEFEGHSLFPAAFSAALDPVRHAGFDWLYALKSVYGWNHYRDRPLF